LREEGRGDAAAGQLEELAARPVRAIEKRLAVITLFLPVAIATFLFFGLWLAAHDALRQ